jgi:PPM family protein phosphatase
LSRAQAPTQGTSGWTAGALLAIFDLPCAALTLPWESLTNMSILETGTIVGAYSIVRSIGTGSLGNEYLARVASDDEDEGSEARSLREPHLRLIAAPPGTLTHVQTLEMQQLRHPHLLALRDFITNEDGDFAIIDIPDNEWPIPLPPSLNAENALAIGAVLGEVIAYLHSRGIVTGEIRPEQIIIVPGNIFYGGIEYCKIASLEGAGTFEQDANALARLINALVPINEPGNETEKALLEIAQRGEMNGYSSVQDVVVDCVRALPDGLPQLNEEDATIALTLEYGHATTVGLLRQQNQDAIGILALEVIDDQPEASPGALFLVADGMGGEAQGEVASRIAARVIVAEVARRFLSPAARSTASDLPRGEQAEEGLTMMHLDSIASLIEAFRAANARIRNMVRRLDRAAGTTATALMLFGHEAILGHVGDSRAYLFRNGELFLITHDHSLVQKLIDIGQFQPGDSDFNIPRNFLYRSLGQNDDLEVDTRVLKVGRGDIFMLCSDGLWDLVPHEAIGEVLATGDTTTAMANELVMRANAAGGHDNSSVIVIRLAPRVTI